MITVKEMVKAQLEAISADGLCDEYECGCGIDDLAPCGQFPTNCVPALKTNKDSSLDKLYEPMRHY